VASTGDAAGTVDNDGCDTADDADGAGGGIGHAGDD